jgi:hypothetical protein
LHSLSHSLTIFIFSELRSECFVVSILC